MDVVKWAVMALVLGIVGVLPGQGSPLSDDDQIKSYAGYTLLRTSPVASHEQTEQLLRYDGQQGVHFWRYPFANHSADILASPSRMAEIRSLLSSMGLSHSTYQRYDSIMNFAKNLAASDPSRVSFSTVGSTTEGRQIGMVKISSGGGGSKPAIWIDGGMHAREWISPATATYIMYKLVKDQSVRSLTDMFDFYIVPVINADGYEYTHTRDRLWRKTRSRQGRCYGVDPNRNWGYHWAESGSSRDPCTDIYHGPRAFSEPETANVANAILQLKNQLKLYLTFHAYSQMWLVPWGFSRSQKPSDYKELMRLGGIGKRALEATYGTRYQLGTAPDLLYAAAGGSDDWAKGSAGIKYSYCLELRPTSQNPGFLLPASQIVPTGEETFNGVAAMAKELYATLKKQQGGLLSRPYASSPVNNTMF